MHDSQTRKDDPRIAIRMSPTEVIEIDAILAVEDRHSVLECALRQIFGVLALEYFYPRMLHVDFCVFVGDHFHRRRKLRNAADVISMTVRSDDRGDGFVSNSSNPVEDRLPVTWVLGVDEDDAPV